jgi:hypothetical protein
VQIAKLCMRVTGETVTNYTETVAPVPVLDLDQVGDLNLRGYLFLPGCHNYRSPGSGHHHNKPSCTHRLKSNLFRSVRCAFE